jgi:hypothetical protein
MAVAAAVAPLTNAEIKKLATEWYRKLDVHAPLAEVTPMLTSKGLEMKFPEATLRTPADFAGWYDRVTRIFFDEVHKVKEVDATITDEGADVKVVVHWEASVWNPPAANSRRIKMDAYQTWYVTRSPETDQPVIVRYTVDKFDYAPNSARL